MRRTILALALVAAATPIAHADPVAYRGGCGFSTLVDTTPAGLGADHVWHAAIDLAVVAPAAVTASCEVRVNGASLGTALRPAPGTRIVDAATVRYAAAPTDIVSLCTHVATAVDCTDVASGQAAFAATLAAIDAAAGLSGPWGLLCGLVSTSDPTELTGNAAQTGEIHAGPLYFGGGTITCTVQSGEQHYTGTNGAFATAAGAGPLVVAPTPVTYTAAEESVYVCTQVTVDGDTSALYFDDATGTWSRDPQSASCSAAVASLDLGMQGRSAGGGHAYGHEQVKNPHNDDPPPPPPPAQPYYPTGTIAITQSLLGGTAYAFSGFTPPLSAWSCSTGGLSSTCTPPPPGSGLYNVCGTVDVTVSTVTGRITGTSACASGPVAWASEEAVSTAPTSSTASPRTSFPWTCSASPQGTTTQWEVVCRVGP